MRGGRDTGLWGASLSTSVERETSFEVVKTLQNHRSCFSEGGP